MEVSMQTRDRNGGQEENTDDTEVAGVVEIVACIPVDTGDSAQSGNKVGNMGKQVDTAVAEGAWIQLKFDFSSGQGTSEEAYIDE